MINQGQPDLLVCAQVSSGLSLFQGPTQRQATGFHFWSHPHRYLPILACLWPLRQLWDLAGLHHLWSPEQARFDFYLHSIQGAAFLLLLLGKKEALTRHHQTGGRRQKVTIPSPGASLTQRSVHCRRLQQPPPDSQRPQLVQDRPTLRLQVLLLVLHHSGPLRCCRR